MDVAVVALQRLCQRPHTGHFVPANVVQQLHPLSRHDAGESVPTLERKMTLMEGLSTLRPVPGGHEPTRSFFLHRATDCDLHIIHLLPRKVRTSDQKSVTSCSTLVN